MVTWPLQWTCLNMPKLYRNWLNDAIINLILGPGQGTPRLVYYGNRHTAPEQSKNKAILTQVKWTETGVDLLHKSHNASVLNPIMHHFLTEMCTCTHISVTKWCIEGYIAGYLGNALWDLWDGSIAMDDCYIQPGNDKILVQVVYNKFCMCVLHYKPVCLEAWE